MLPIENRLKKKKDFERVFKKGKGFKEDFLFIKVVPNHLKVSKFGFIVGEKVSRKATLRNKTKRRLRELTRIRLSKIKTGFDVALVAIPGLENKSFEEMENLIDRIFKKAKLYQ